MVFSCESYPPDGVLGALSPLSPPLFSSREGVPIPSPKGKYLTAST